MDKSQAGIKIARGNTNNPRYEEDTTLIRESEEELNNLLMRVKKESEVDKMEALTDLFSWAPKSLQTVTTAMKLNDTCSLEGKL